MSDAPWRVAKTVKENEDVTSVYFEPEALSEADRKAAHKPGQFATLRIMEDGEWSRPHPFTISCAPEDRYLRMTIKRAGDFTAKVPELKPGDQVRCAGPFGAFCKDIETHKELALIAGGVGVTPFLAVLEHFERIGADNRVTLIWANKTRQDAFALGRLEELMQSLDLRVVLVFSREDVPPAEQRGSFAYATGRVTRSLLADYARSPEVAFYLCGPPAMQNHVLEELSACGVDPGRVELESFGGK